MDIFAIIRLLGGLAMFLYGMEVMGDGLKQGSSEALKRVLGKLTQNVFLGVVTGMIVTAVIQSSTATIVLTVALIGAGTLTLKQAVGIVMGANIGTTVTAQIIRLMDIEAGAGSLLNIFKPDTLAPIAMIAGIILIMFIKKSSAKLPGQICMGFGVLFIGLLNMTDSVTPLAESQAFIDFLARFSNLPLLGIFAGLVTTVIVQSSSAMVGVLQALSDTGAINFNLVYPVIMGINLGTCVTTAIVCSIGSSKDAKRTGLVHILFNCIGTVLFMIVMAIIKRTGGFPDLWTKICNSGDIANFQTLFNLVTAIILVPFSGLLVKLSLRIIKPDKEKPDAFPELAALDEKLFLSPAVAMSEVTKAVAVMGRAASGNFALSFDQLLNYKTEITEKITHYENRIDQFADTADNYLIKLSKHADTAAMNKQLNLLMQTVPSIERIGDYATNIDELALRLKNEQLELSADAKRELSITFGAVTEIITLTTYALEVGDVNMARRIEPLEEVIDDMVLMLKNRHTERLRQGICSINTGLVFMEVLTYLERASDQCSTIAMLIMARENEDILKNHHEYIKELHKGGDAEYNSELETRRRQYILPLEEF